MKDSDNNTGAYAAASDALQITPRKILPALSSTTPRYWFDGHPFKTHYFNALSSTFPVGERFFIKSVRHFEKRIGNGELSTQVKNFVGQEGFHSIEHDQHIKILYEQGYSGLRNFERLDKMALDVMNRYFPRLALAATISLEHFTAILSNEMLSHPDRWLQPMHKDVRLLWHWHAVEETEHKAVAFDVYQETCGSYPLRVFAMLLETFGLLLDVFVRTCYFLWKDGKIFSPRIWAQGVIFVWGRHGALRSVAKDYFKFYRRDFHPWDMNNYHFVEEFLSRHHRQLAVQNRS